MPSSFPGTGPESAGFRTKSVRRKIREDPTFGSHSPDGQRHMKSIWRRHWIICLCLGLLTIPIYFLDLALFAGSSGGWISLDFRGLLFRSYGVWLGIEIALSSIGVQLFHKAGALLIHLGSMMLSVILLVATVAGYSQLRRQAVSNEQKAF